jgi:hypothetical protein
MPQYEVGDVVYAIKELRDPPSGDSPGGYLCDFADKLIIRDVFLPKNGMHSYLVSHEPRVKPPWFQIYGNEISTMKHFSHNKPFHWTRPNGY